MKKRIQLGALLVTAIFTLSVLSGCGNKNTYKDDIAVEDLANSVVSAIGSSTDEMLEQPDSYIENFMKTNVSSFDEYIVMRNYFGTSIDEFGIFKGKDAAHTKEVAAIVENYLELLVTAWNGNYTPEETPKLKAAEFKVFGNYVMYTILSDENRPIAFETLENALK